MIPISLPLPRRANLPATFGLKASFALFALLPLRVCRPATGLSVDRQQQLAIDPCVCPQPIIIMAAGEAGRVARSGSWRWHSSDGSPARSWLYGELTFSTLPRLRGRIGVNERRKPIGVSMVFLGLSAGQLLTQGADTRVHGQLHGAAYSEIGLHLQL
jgi:hypothetical protein